VANKESPNALGVQLALQILRNEKVTTRQLSCSELHSTYPKLSPLQSTSNTWDDSNKTFLEQILLSKWSSSSTLGLYKMLRAKFTKLHFLQCVWLALTIYYYFFREEITNEVRVKDFVCVKFVCCSFSVSVCNCSRTNCILHQMWCTTNKPFPYKALRSYCCCHQTVS
jgi:hypothetical protein